MKRIELLEAALVGLQKMAAEVEAELASLRGTGVYDALPAIAAPRRTMSAAGRKAISRAQRKRWAQVHAKQDATGPRSARPFLRPALEAAKKGGRA